MDRNAAAANEPAPVEEGTLSRSSRLIRFALRHRHLGRRVQHGATRAEDEEAHSAADAQAFVEDLQALGPAFVKIGQTLSTRPDLMPPEYLAALEQLQDDNPPVEFTAIRNAIEKELGVRLSKAFAVFDPEPIAAASLAQVHRATLRDGRPVAVKVQRPGIADAIAADLKSLGGLARAADRFTEHGKRVRFGNWITEVSETLGEELDYRLEAENLQLFRANLGDYPRIFVPQPHPDLSSTHVLTMDLVQGHKITQAIELRRTEEKLGELGTELLRAYLDQIFVHGLVHADPHPGNVMLTDDGRIALVDLGMVVRLGPRMRDSLLKLLHAAVEGDGDRVAEESVKVGERLEVFDDDAWHRRCGRLISRYATQGEQGPLGEGQLMIELTRLSIDCGLRPPPEVALLGKTLLNLDNVSRLLDPGVPVKAVVRERMHELMSKRMKQMISPSAAAGQLFEMAELGRELPAQLRGLLDTLAHNRLRVRISGLEESRLLENLQKIANRISAGVITASLIIGAALALRIDAGPRLWGYPALALVMFLLASLLGAGVVLSALMKDRKMSRYRGRKK